MQFLTKSQIREKLEEFLEGYDNRTRITYSEDWDKEFIHIGQPVEKTISQEQTFLNKLFEEPIESYLQDTHQYDKDIRQGNFRS